MSITAGARIGAYEVLAAIGAGGMGEVYRARDTRLNRDVALKILPEIFAADPDRLARFEREAQVLASLNHPHIAQIYGMEEGPADHQGPRRMALVMELVDGETLADRIDRGPIPLNEALAIAKQIAEALETAHEHGIIHRDLKPANVKVRADGAIKVLDFGLAKAFDHAPTAAPAVTQSPTLSLQATYAGVILGTAAYMSPEQAVGKPVDKRADIWSFGVVLWEMLTGRRLFAGETISDTLADVLRQSIDLDVLPRDTPAAIRQLLQRCLDRDAKRRLRDIGEARVCIDRAIAAPDEPAATTSASAATGMWRRRLAWASVLLLAASAVAAVVVIRFDRSQPVSRPIQFTIAAPGDETLATVPGGGTGAVPQVAISPDGQTIAFIAHKDNDYRIWLRPLGALEARPLPGTEGAAFPFWSPDNRYIGFFAGGKLKKVNVAGGPPLVLCDAPGGRGGTWNRDNVIVFAPNTSGGLQRVSAAGGIPVAASTLDTRYGETGHRFPSFLPDGRHFLYSGVVGTCCPPTKPGRLQIGVLDAMESRTLLEVESSAIYADGHVLYSRTASAALTGTLMAQPFDLTSLAFTEDPFPVAEEISSEGSRYVTLSASQTGALVYAAGATRPARQPTWFDRTGKQLRAVGDPSLNVSLSLSADGRSIAVSSNSGSNRDIWIVDQMTGARTRLTFDPGSDDAPIWSPDDQKIVFSAIRSGRPLLLQKLASGTAGEERLLDDGDVRGVIYPTDWSADGRYILYQRTAGVGGLSDVWVLPLFGDRKPSAYLQTPTSETDATFSPDGKWVAYQSAETGNAEVFVQPFPATGGKFQVSQGGGSKPIWRRDGRELFFLSPEGRMMAAAVETTGGEFHFGAPVPLFQIVTGVAAALARQYAVTPDGTRFLVNVAQQTTANVPLTVVVNWLSAVPR